MDLAEQIRVFSEVDSELLGSDWGAGLRSPELMSQVLEGRGWVHETWGRGGTVVVMGAGTSGRIAFMATDHFSSKHRRVAFLMAGGSAALIRAQEGAEDNPGSGVEQLKALMNRMPGPHLLLGVTCGLSAPYVLHAAHWMHNQGARVIVLGFNSPESVSSIAIGALTVTDFLVSLRQLDRGMLMNPVLGPEAITGSTRLKGGSATWVLLSWLLGESAPDLSALEQTLDRYLKRAHRLSDTVASVGQSLRSGRGVQYLTDRRYGLSAIMDAAECGPTFGASFSDVRAFVRGGWRNYRLSHTPPESIAFSRRPTCLGTCIALGETVRDSVDLTAILQPAMGENGWLQLLTVKWALNVISSLGFVRAGKVLGNLMIDLRISNRKLWLRAVRIVQQVAQLESIEAESVLLQAAGLTPDMSIDERVTVCAGQTGVVPRAIIMARRDLARDDACEALASGVPIHEWMNP
ncbi:MAG: hypothetical protein KDC35_19610 [Acidobacteria bacterium]|nr:hypothetical protein [Acidobacteriota bacterium]